MAAQKCLAFLAYRRNKESWSKHFCEKKRRRRRRKRERGINEIEREKGERTCVPERKLLKR